MGFLVNLLERLRHFAFGHRHWPQIPFDEIRKRARLLVIDDEEFPYHSLFSRDGYNLDKWHDVQDLSILEDGKYDLLLLDLHGVGRLESGEQGFGILKYLRRRCPSLVIVAYSSAEWGLRYQEFFRLADAVLPKTADYVEFKARVDELLSQRFSLGFFVSKILDEVGSYEADPAHLTQLAQRAILSGNTQRLRAHLHSTIPRDSAVTVDRVLSIANSAVGILQLWTR